MALAKEREKEPKSGPGRLRAAGTVLLHAFTRNLPAKTAALLLAALVWFTVRQEITAVEVVPHAGVRVLNPDELILTVPPPAEVTVEFSGPKSQIDALQQAAEQNIRIEIRAEDLLDQNRRTIEFSPLLGNLHHSYGRDVEIVGMTPARFQVEIARRGEVRLPLGRPRVESIPGDWALGTLSFLPGPEAVVVGPAHVLEDLATGERQLELAPIRADALREAAQDTEVLLFEAELAPELRRRLVSFLPGETPRITATFVRSEMEEEIELPITVYYTRLDPSILLEFHETNLVRKTDDGDRIRVKFVGTPRNLEDLKEAVAAGEARFYVRAEESGAYEGDLNWRDYLVPHLELPSDLRPHIRYRTFDYVQKIMLSVRKP